MLIRTVNDNLIWEQVNHHALNRVTSQIANMYHAEILDYQNEELSVRTIFNLQEMKTGSNPFSLNIVSYTNIKPNILRLEFSETKHIGDYPTFSEAKEAAHYYFYKHLHPKHSLHHVF